MVKRGEKRKCSATVVGSDLVLGLSMVWRCSLKWSFKRHLVSPLYCQKEKQKKKRFIEIHKPLILELENVLYFSEKYS